MNLQISDSKLRSIIKKVSCDDKIEKESFIEYRKWVDKYSSELRADEKKAGMLDAWLFDTTKYFLSYKTMSLYQ